MGQALWHWHLFIPGLVPPSLYTLSLKFIIHFYLITQNKIESFERTLLYIPTVLKHPEEKYDQHCIFNDCIKYEFIYLQYYKYMTHVTCTVSTMFKSSEK